MNKTKTCSNCGFQKPLSEFNRRKEGSVDGYTGRCKDCIKSQLSDYYKENGEKIRAYRRNYGRVSRYGVSDLDVAQMIENQGGRCAICEKGITAKDHVDHDHETGFVRAILCKRCNIALGLFDDDIGNMARAMDYLIFHKWQRIQENE